MEIFGLGGAFDLAFRPMEWHEYYTDEDFALERVDGAFRLRGPGADGF